MAIDSNAIIDPSAKIHKNAEICAYAVIGANVEIGSGTIVESHAVIQGPTKLAKITTSTLLLQLVETHKTLPTKKVKNLIWSLVMTT